MKSHLKSAIDRFKKSKGKEEYLINPISEIDAEIIVEISQIFKKLNRNDLFTIIDNWKYNKDTETRDDLLQWNIDNSMLVKGEEVDVNPDLTELLPPSDIMKFNDEYIELRFIYNFDKIDDWDYDNSKPIYGIKFNEVPADVTKTPYMGNKKIFFYDIDERDREYNRLEDYYMGSNDYRII